MRSLVQKRPSFEKLMSCKGLAFSLCNGLRRWNMAFQFHSCNRYNNLGKHRNLDHPHIRDPQPEQSNNLSTHFHKLSAPYRLCRRSILCKWYRPRQHQDPHTGKGPAHSKATWARRPP
jgi:hypothetical protein